MLEKKSAVEVLANLKEYTTLLSEIQQEMEHSKHLRDIAKREYDISLKKNKELTIDSEKIITENKRLKVQNLEIQKKIGENMSILDRVEKEVIETCSKAIDKIEEVESEYENKKKRADDEKIIDKDLIKRERLITEKELSVINKKQELEIKEQQLIDKELTIQPSLDSIEREDIKLRELKYDLRVKEKRLDKRLNQLKQ